MHCAQFQKTTSLLIFDKKDKLTAEQISKLNFEVGGANVINKNHYRLKIERKK